MAIIGAKEEHVDPRLTTLAQGDKLKWYRKPNLRMLYLVRRAPCTRFEMVDVDTAGGHLDLGTMWSGRGVDFRFRFFHDELATSC